MRDKSGSELTNDEAHQLLLDAGAEWRTEFRARGPVVPETPSRAVAVDDAPSEIAGVKIRRRSSKWVPMLAAACAVLVVALAVSWFTARSGDRDAAGNNPDLLPWACGQTLTPLEGVTARKPTEQDFGSSGSGGQVAVAADSAQVKLVSVRSMELTAQGTVASYVTGENQQMPQAIRFIAMDISDGRAQMVSPEAAATPCAGMTSVSLQAHAVIIAIVEGKLVAMDAGPMSAFNS